MRFWILAAALMVAAPAAAQTYSTIFYRKNPRLGTDDIFLGEYGSREAFLGGTGQLTNANWILNRNYGIGGLDIGTGGAVSLLFYRKEPRLQMDDVFLGEYASRADFLNGTGQLTNAKWALNGAYGMGGLDIAPSGAVSVIFYRKEPRLQMDDVFLGEYASTADFLNGAGQLTNATWILNGAYGIGGLDIASSGAVSLLFYRKEPRLQRDDVYLGQYASRADLLSGMGVLTNATWLLNGSYALGGLEISEPLQPPPPGGVPEPATWAMLILGFGLVGGVARRRQVAAV